MTRILTLLALLLHSCAPAYAFPRAPLDTSVEALSELPAPGDNV